MTVCVWCVDKQNSYCSKIWEGRCYRCYGWRRNFDCGFLWLARSGERARKSKGGVRCGGRAQKKGVKALEQRCLSWWSTHTGGKGERHLQITKAIVEGIKQQVVNRVQCSLMREDVKVYCGQLCWYEENRFKNLWELQDGLWWSYYHFHVVPDRNAPKFKQ